MVMATLLASPWASWGIAGLATAGVILRPFSWPEYVWAVGGAVLLVALGLLSPADALSGVTRGTDVYLFLTGMMLLSELARQEGLFDWVAARVARAWPGGSAASACSRWYSSVGTVVTVFLSNDATAVVLTPAVAAAAQRRRKAEKPLPYLFICAFTWPMRRASCCRFRTRPTSLSTAATCRRFCSWLPRLWVAVVAQSITGHVRWCCGGLSGTRSCARRYPPRISTVGEAVGRRASWRRSASWPPLIVLPVVVGLRTSQLGLPTFLAGLGTDNPGPDAGPDTGVAGCCAQDHLLGRAAAGGGAVRAGGGAGEDRGDARASRPHCCRRGVQAFGDTWRPGYPAWRWRVGCNLVNNLPAGPGGGPRGGRSGTHAGSPCAARS